MTAAVLSSSNCCSCKDEPCETGVDRIYIGSRAACAVAAQHGITHILSVSTNDISVKSKSIVYLFVRVADDEPNLIHVIRESLFRVRDILKTPSHRVMIRCENGHNRSAATICAYAMKFRKIKLNSVLEMMRKVKPCIKPCTTFMDQLGIFEINLFKHLKLQRPENPMHTKNSPQSENSPQLQQRTLLTKQVSLLPPLPSVAHIKVGGEKDAKEYLQRQLVLGTKAQSHYEERKHTLPHGKWVVFFADSRDPVIAETESEALKSIHEPVYCTQHFQPTPSKSFVASVSTRDPLAPLVASVCSRDTLAPLVATASTRDTLAPLVATASTRDTLAALVATASTRDTLAALVASVSTRDTLAPPVTSVSTRDTLAPLVATASTRDTVLCQKTICAEMQPYAWKLQHLRLATDLEKGVVSALLLDDESEEYGFKLIPDPYYEPDTTLMSLTEPSWTRELGWCFTKYATVGVNDLLSAVRIKHPRLREVRFHAQMVDYWFRYRVDVKEQVRQREQHRRHMKQKQSIASTCTSTLTPDK